MICSDPALLARAKVSIRLYADFLAADRGYAEQAQEGQGWPYVLDKCADRACLLSEYNERISWIATPFEVPDYRIRGAQRLNDAENIKTDWKRLELLPAGNDLVFFRLSSSYQKGGPDMAPFNGGATGFFRLEADHGTYRDTDDSGFDFQRDPKGGWRVIQIGDCPCGAHISLDGLYR